MPRPIFKKIKLPSNISRKQKLQFLGCLLLIIIFSVAIATYNLYAENRKLAWCKGNFVQEQQLIAKNDWEKSSVLAGKILDKCRNNADSSLVFNLNHDLALSNFMLGQKEQAKPYAKEALKVYGKLSADQRNKVGSANTKIFVVSDISNGIYKHLPDNKVTETPLSEVKR